MSATTRTARNWRPLLMVSSATAAVSMSTTETFFVFASVSATAGSARNVSAVAAMPLHTRGDDLPRCTMGAVQPLAGTPSLLHMHCVLSSQARRGTFFAAARAVSVSPEDSKFAEG